MKLRNALISFFLVALYTAPFFVPNKYYPVTIIPWYALAGIHKEGYQLGYGINLVNIFMVLAILSFIRTLFDRTQRPLFPIRSMLFFFVPAFFFIVVAAIASLVHSPFTALSFTWLFQYGQMYGAAFLVLYVFMREHKFFPMIFDVLAINLLFQSVISIFQFVHQSALGIPIEYAGGGGFSAAVDANSTFYRVAGTFLFANQLALITLVLLLIVAPQIVHRNNRLYVIALFSSIPPLILAQGRAIWLLTVMVTFFFVRYFRTELARLLKRIPIHTFVTIILVILISLSSIIYPRIIVSVNAMYQGGAFPLRIHMIQEGLAALAQNLWFGYGIGTNEHVLYTQFPDGVMRIFPTAIHFGYLQMALEVGLVGLFCFLFPFIYLIRKLVLNTHTHVRQSKEYQYITLLGCATFGVYYLFQPHVGIVEFFYLGLIGGFGLIEVYLLHSASQYK